MPLELADTADLALYREGDDETLLTMAQAAVRDRCGWHISPELEDVDLTVLAWSGVVVVLPSRYITDVSEVSVDGVIQPTTAYEWHQDGWIRFLTRRYCWPVNVVATVTHGYAVTPPAVTKAVLDFVEQSKSAASVAGLTHLRVGQVDRTFMTAADLPGATDAALSALAPYTVVPGFA